MKFIVSWLVGLALATIYPYSADSGLDAAALVVPILFALATFAGQLILCHRCRRLLLRLIPLAPLLYLVGLILFSFFADRGIGAAIAGMLLSLMGGLSAAAILLAWIVFLVQKKIRFKGKTQKTCRFSAGLFWEHPWFRPSGRTTRHR